jgi:ribosomal protein S18 acetylase RimI-like enzyme
LWAESDFEWGGALAVLEIRRYQEHDHAAVWELHVVAMQVVGAYWGDGPWDDDLRDIYASYLQSDGEFLVGLEAGRLVAMGAFRKTSSTHAEIKRMRVHPTRQGHGYGQLIYGALEARARERGYQMLHLETSVLQQAAQRLYERNGFRAVRREVLGGFDCIFYEKQLW